MSELYPPGPSGTATLVPVRGMQPVSTHPGHGSTAVTLPQPVRRSFRRSFLDRQDPFEAGGLRMPRFSFSDSYDFDSHSPQEAVEEIRTRLYKQLADGNLASARLELVDWDDASLTDEPARRFVVTHTTTQRNTRVTVNAYFQAYGDHLYYSVRSYILPLLSIWKLLLALFITTSTLSLVGSLPPGAQGRCLFVVALVLAIHLRGFIIDLLAGDPFDVALRKQYPGKLNSASFDYDDATAFLKTNVSLTLSTVATVLEQYDIDTGGLRMIVQQMGSININTGGGSIIGAAIGGIANRAKAGVRA
jgi:hypothetical protein